MLLVPGAALAAGAEHVHGVVLGLEPKTGEAIVRHDPIGSMPAMTMPFRIVPRARLGELQPGSEIDASLDRSSEPWTLRNVTVKSTQSLTAQLPLRRVTPLRVGDVVPDTPFFDQRGRPFRMSDLRGQDVVLAFIYTRCQDARMCPLISTKFNALQRRIGTRKLHLVEVTLDPSYDRPPVLARYGTTFGADPAHWTMAVGDAEPTLDFAARFGITAFPDPSIGIIHAENTVEIDRGGRIINMSSTTAWQPDEILADIDAAEGRASNPIARFDLWLSRAAVAVCGNNVGGFSGIGDLAVVLVIFGALIYLLVRLARGIFANPTP